MSLFCLGILYRSVIVFVSLSALCDAPWWSVLSLRASHTLSHPHTKLWQQLGFTAPRPAGFTRQTDPSRRKPISQEQRGQVRACLECSPAPSGGWGPFSTSKRTLALLRSWLHSCFLNFPVPHPKVLTLRTYILSVKKPLPHKESWEDERARDYSSKRRVDKRFMLLYIGLTGGTTINALKQFYLHFECICQTLL